MYTIIYFRHFNRFTKDHESLQSAIDTINFKEDCGEWATIGIFEPQTRIFYIDAWGFGEERKEDTRKHVKELFDVEILRFETFTY